MVPAKFEYLRASSVDEALRMLEEQGDDARLLAGGHSLLPAMKLRLSEPSALIDISKIDELSYIREDGGGLVIGAATTHASIEHSDLVKSKAPLLAENAGWIGDIQVRNRGTLGGSIAHADPASDYPAALLALDAEVTMRGSSGPRTVAATDFFIDIYHTALNEGEIVTQVRVPSTPNGRGGSYAKFPQPASRFALVGCAAMVTVDDGVCKDVRVAFNGVANAAFRDSGVEAALNGQSADETSVAVVVANSAAGVDVMSDHYASEEYRRHLAGVFAKRAIMQAIKNA
ncbi:MAG: FAD binding domain-containing protein [Calditrichia bacterium]